MELRQSFCSLEGHLQFISAAAFTASYEKGFLFRVPSSPCLVTVTLLIIVVKFEIVACGCCLWANFRIFQPQVPMQTLQQLLWTQPIQEWRFKLQKGKGRAKNNEPTWANVSYQKYQKHPKAVDRQAKQQTEFSWLPSIVSPIVSRSNISNLWNLHVPARCETPRLPCFSSLRLSLPLSPCALPLSSPVGFSSCNRKGQKCHAPSSYLLISYGRCKLLAAHTAHVPSKDSDILTCSDGLPQASPAIMGYQTAALQASPAGGCLIWHQRCRNANFVLAGLWSRMAVWCCMIFQ